VTTESAKRLYADMAQIRVGQLSSQSLPGFVDQWQVSCILDASHPFASEISRLAIALAQTQSIPYLRYERETVDCTHQAADPSVILVDSVESLISSDILRYQRVLFTVGYRYLSQFSHLRPDARLFARILPSVEAIAGATAAGFAPADIIALRPPVSAALEAALWQHWKITRVVAKASGVPSGEATKRKLADQLGVRLILIQRPQLVYPNQTNSVIEATDFCSKIILVQNT